jgi:hypothetical protein
VERNINIGHAGDVTHGISCTTMVNGLPRMASNVGPCSLGLDGVCNTEYTSKEHRNFECRQPFSVQNGKVGRKLFDIERTLLDSGVEHEEALAVSDSEQHLERRELRKRLN